MLLLAAIRSWPTSCRRVDKRTDEGHEFGQNWVEVVVHVPVFVHFLHIYATAGHFGEAAGGGDAVKYHSLC